MCVSRLGERVERCFGSVLASENSLPELMGVLRVGKTILVALFQFGLFLEQSEMRDPIEGTAAMTHARLLSVAPLTLLYF